MQEITPESTSQPSLKYSDLLSIQIVRQMVKLGRDLLNISSSSAFTDVCIVLERRQQDKDSHYAGTVVDCAESSKSSDFARVFMKVWYAERQ